VKRVVRKLVVVTVATMTMIGLGASEALALQATPDPSWMTNGKVFGMVQAGGMMFLGGQFTQLRSTPSGVAGPKIAVHNLGAVDVASGAGIGGFAPSITHPTDAAFVRALAVSPDGSRLYVGGHFSAIDGVPARNLAAIDLPTLAVDASFKPTAGGLGAAVYAILPAPDGSKVYVGGSFTSFNGSSRTRLAAIFPDGSLEPSWLPAANKHVRSLELASDGSTIFVGGAFTTLNGTNRQQVARVDASTGALHPWSIPSGTLPQPMVAWSLDVTSTRLYGGFGKGPNFAAAFRLDNGNNGTQVWRFNTVGNVQKVALSEDASQLFIGGHFGTGSLQQWVCGSAYLRALAVLSASSGALNCSWIPQLEPHGSNYQGVWDIDLTATHVWFSGRFNSVSGVAQQNVARVLR
jgi:hypothetical protein